MRVEKIVAFANQKGGVGKTTSAVNTAAALGSLGYKTLLIDLDPQGSATSGVGVSKRGLRYTARNLLAGGCRAQDAVLHTEFDNLDLIPANIELAEAEFALLQTSEGEFQLKNALAEIRRAYDYIIIDCPPSLGMLTVNALTAAHGVVIPMPCEYYALEGLMQLSATVSRIKKTTNPRLVMTGILITMYQARTTLSAQVLAELKNYYGDRLFEQKISRSIRLTESPGFGKPILYYSPRAKSAAEYLALAKELHFRV